MKMLRIIFLGLLAVPAMFLTGCSLAVHEDRHAYYDDGYYYRPVYRDSRYGRVVVQPRVIILDGRRHYVYDRW